MGKVIEIGPKDQVFPLLVKPLPVSHIQPIEPLSDTLGKLLA